MREIKFRAWDKDKKSMLSWEDMKKDTNIDGIESVYVPIDIIAVLMDEKEVQYYRMQFTGLKDKNGKEIYEGDIVEFTDIQNYEFRKKYIVVWNDKGFWLTDKLNGGYYTSVNNWNNLKVIGNIYEKTRRCLNARRNKSATRSCKR